MDDGRAGPQVEPEAPAVEHAHVTWLPGAGLECNNSSVTALERERAWTVCFQSAICARDWTRQPRQRRCRHSAECLMC